MTALTLELPPELYARLRAEAECAGKPMTTVVEEWLSERLRTPSPGDDRARTRAALRAAGLLVEPPPEERARAEAVTVTLEEVRAALDHAGGTPLSEIVLARRGPKA